MIATKAYAAYKAKETLKPFEFHRREPGPHDVLIDIHYSGICHSDIHQAREEWGPAIFPMVPGHEIVGKVARVGSQVTKFKVGDFAGVGCFVDSCRTCGSCRDHLEQYCENGMVPTYNGLEKDRKTPTYGGYSNKIVVDENYVLRISPKLSLASAAPLLCAGITTYSPLRHWKAGPGKRVAVMGLGGLGHMAVKLGAAMGAEVTVLTTSENKKADALRLGAKNVAGTRNDETFKKYAGYFDIIIDTVTAAHDLNQYLSLLRRDGAMVLLGIPDPGEPLHSFSLIMKRLNLCGSLIGGIEETQEMLDFCAEKGIGSDIELIRPEEINAAYERTIKGDVKYRFVIDMTGLH